MQYHQLMIKKEIQRLIADAYQSGYQDAYDNAHPEVGMPAPPRGCESQLVEFEELWSNLNV